ncbi:MAG: hypothetical protein ACAI34_02250 [Verrucomicrobium sp.]|nr:hypothetical protein [Verrucomicrobium sp.]
MRNIIRLAIAVAVIALGWFAWPFMQSPAKQAEVRHKALFEKASKRDWKSASGFLAAGYEDQWGNKPSEAIELAKELLQGFLILEIKWETTELGANEDIVKVRGHARMEGNGMGVSQMVMSKVNQIHEPWVFTWKKEGWKPGDWKLSSVTNKDLEGVGLPADL